MPLISATLLGNFDRPVDVNLTHSMILNVKHVSNAVSFKTYFGRITIFNNISLKITNVKNAEKVLKLCFNITRTPFFIKIVNCHYRLKVNKPKSLFRLSTVNCAYPFKLMSNLFGTNSSISFCYKVKHLQCTNYKVEPGKILRIPEIQTNVKTIVNLFPSGQLTCSGSCYEAIQETIFHFFNLLKKIKSY